MAAKLRNCQGCGKLFMSQHGERLCQPCVEAQAKLEGVVVEYVRDHPKCKIVEIMEETGASEAMIRRLIDEGRFEQVGVKVTYPCKKCGKEIVVGQYCDSCLQEMQSELHSASKQMSGVAEAAAAAARGHGMYSKDLKKPSVATR